MLRMRLYLLDRHDDTPNPHGVWILFRICRDYSCRYNLTRIVRSSSGQCSGKFFDRSFQSCWILNDLCTPVYSTGIQYVCITGISTGLRDFILGRKGCSQYPWQYGWLSERYVYSRWEKYTPYPGVNTKGMNGPDGTNNDGIKS